MTGDHAPPPWTEVAATSGADADVGAGPEATTAGGTETARIREADGLLLLCDFDGTLADIQPRPDAARIRPGARRTLAKLAAQPRTAVAVVSGRALEDVRARVDLDGVAYAGNHGLEIETPDRRFVHPEAEGAVSTVESVCATLRERLAGIEGVVVEDKGLSATVHYRRVPPEDVEAVLSAVREVVGGQADSASERPAGVDPGEGGDVLRIEEGKQIVEVKPAVEWDKGRAVEWLRDVLVPDDVSWYPIYVGDDVTDEDAFRALEGVGTAVRVGEADQPTAADVRVSDPAAVEALLEWLVALRSGPDGA